jgi:hypothetical protein
LFKQFSVITALLVISFGFSTAFADSGISSDLDVQTNPMLNDRPFLLDQIQVMTSLDFQDSTANMLAIFLLAVPFGLIVYRMSDHEPIPVQTVKLSSVVVFFAMVSMFSFPLSTGNSLWGYAYATPVDSLLDIPQPKNSLYFDSSDKNFSNKGGSTILENKNSALSLDGKNDYLIVDSKLPSKLERFSVSAWVKPDYSKSASALSVVSEADAFDLSINNKHGKHTAEFAVFDGIAWHSVKSRVNISETWTHLAATYSGNTLKIFVNGMENNSAIIDQNTTMTYETGVPTPIEFEYISSKSDILVGAFNPNLREESTTKNHFSGLIDDVTIYDKLLTTLHVSKIYEQNRTSESVPVMEFAPLVIEAQPTGEQNQYGFISNSKSPNDQKIESTASEGFKVKKPEDKKKKKPVEEITPQNIPSESDIQIETSSASSTQSTESTNNFSTRWSMDSRNSCR